MFWRVFSKGWDGWLARGLAEVKGLVRGTTMVMGGSDVGGWVMGVGDSDAGVDGHGPCTFGPFGVGL